MRILTACVQISIALLVIVSISFVFYGVDLSLLRVNYSVNSFTARPFRAFANFTDSLPERAVRIAPLMSNDAELTPKQRNALKDATRTHTTAPFAGRALALADLDVPTWASELSPFHPDVVSAHKHTKASGPTGKMLIVVPFREHSFNVVRERSEHVLMLVEKLDTHLRAVGKVPGRDYATLIVEMHDQDVAFNKAYLLNAGAYVATAWGYDYVVFHDADCYPASLQNTYDMSLEDDLPVHYSPTINGNYLIRGSHFGGVFAAYTKTYAEVGGLPNNLWGWGFEDNMMMYRFHRHKGFRRLNKTAGSYDIVLHERPTRVNRRKVPSARNNANMLYQVVARGKYPAIARDDYKTLNATMLRYAPMPNLGAFHWVTVSLDSMAYRPEIEGLESVELTEARLSGALPSLEELGLWTDGTLPIVPPLTAKEEARVRAFIGLVRPFRERQVTRAGRLETLNGENLDEIYAESKREENVA